MENSDLDKVKNDFIKFTKKLIKKVNSNQIILDNELIIEKYSSLIEININAYRSIKRVEAVVAKVIKLLEELDKLL
ncbi:MAG: hypothetical protein CMJ25_27275 [Phycisphaerae bacterium]|mgnify:FL=1|nr:hypothetical protein [Phycisphaerae bacterium]|tara:strand:+ start:267 stop:494 length:228 start_codon:yes stop_codon:yes gene_type:complete